MHVQLRLEDFLIFGTYPEMYLAENREEKIRYLSDLRDAYLFKDILELENLKNPRILHDLLNLLAFQIGKEVTKTCRYYFFDNSVRNAGLIIQLSPHTPYRFLRLLSLFLSQLDQSGKI
jgi:hypothetical protein